MPSITTWARLEPQTLSNDVEAGLAARLHDPVWMLSRQWQVGEFQGEDGGSPIVARWRGQVAPLVRYHLGPIEPETQITAPRFDSDRMPLEALVERQPVRQTASDAPGADALRLGVETGRHFLRLLRLQSTTRDYTDAFTRTYPLAAPDEEGQPIDPASIGYARVLAGRALDGRRLRAALARGSPPPLDGTTVDPGDVAEIRAACAAWLDWAEDLFSQPDEDDQAWQPDRMEYAFSVTARLGVDAVDERTLTAAQYTDGTLDWYSFDLNGHVNLGTTVDDAGAVVTRTVLPAPVTLQGMPAHRFWELEDALLDLGALQPGATEIPQLLTIETITGYGNDWFVIPIDLPVGSLVASRSLVVTDTFGFGMLLRPNGDHHLDTRSAWNMFQLAMPVDSQEPEGIPATNLFFLPPTLAQPQEGAVLEEVLLLRDETANMAWAVERRLESPLERALDAASDDRDPGVVEAEAPEVPAYRLASAIPSHWIPLLPVRTDASEQVRLARAGFLTHDGSHRVVRSQARVLGDNPTSPLLIPEEEVPREGAVVRRAYQGARWHDGRLIVWSAHRKSVGRGEGSSGLRFDTLDQ